VAGASTYPALTLTLLVGFSSIFLAPCHCSMTGHLPACSIQLPPGSTISSGQFLWLSASPCSLMPAPVSLLHCSRRYHCGLFSRDLLMLHFGFHVFRI
jgi:hypothetical protein